MPVIVIGADTGTGMEILDALYQPGREVRAFVSDVDTGSLLRLRGIKVALGDVSDESHVELASTRCFTAVLIAEAAHDERERSFAGNPAQVMEGWARAIASSEVSRAIWVVSGEPPVTRIKEVAVVDPASPDVARSVVALDDAQNL